MSWQNILKKEMRKAAPYKGNQNRQRRGWDDRIAIPEDTRIFFAVLVDIYNWSKKQMQEWLERTVNEPEMWQQEYEIFLRTLDLKHYSNDRIDDDLSEHTFADWFKEEWVDDWNALSDYLDEIELDRAQEGQEE